VYPVFEALDKVEKMLEGKDFFVGNQLTEADIRLWVTIVSLRGCFYLYACFPFCRLAFWC
jgi:glutathionyl-hydroquinone reductase